MVKLSFYKTHCAFLHEMFVEQLRALSRQANRSDMQSEFRVFHHILPQFEGGTDAHENCVYLYQYEHSLVHLLRFLWKKNGKDLNAFSSACLTIEQVQKRGDFFNKNREKARDKTVRNTEWQEISGRKGIEKSVEKRKNFPTEFSDDHHQKLSDAARKTQPKSIRSRISLWSRFLCTCKLTFQNIKTSEKFSFEQVDISENRTVVDIARSLKEQFPNCGIPEKNEWKFAELFRLEKSKKWGWTFFSLTVENSGQCFEILFSVFCTKGQLLHKLFLLLVYYIYGENNLYFSFSQNQKNLFEKTVISIFSAETGLSETAIFCIYHKMILFLEDSYKTFPTEKASNPEIAEISKSSFSPCISLSEIIT